MESVAYKELKTKIGCSNTSSANTYWAEPSANITTGKNTLESKKRKNTQVPGHAITDS